MDSTLSQQISIRYHQRKLGHHPEPFHLVETAHAGRNAETSIGVGLLTAILQFVFLPDFICNI
jgi:hypothetical protein